MAGKTTEQLRPVPAVSRAIAILRFLGRAAEPVGVNRIARELGIVPSTCLHILRVLRHEGLTEFDLATKRYSIGAGILPIARSAIEQNGFARLIEPHLTSMSQTFGGTAVATQLMNDDQMIVVALSRAQQPFRLQVDLGSRFPALISATGRCHAALNLKDINEAALKAQFEQLKWSHPPPFDQWRREVAQVLRDGYAIDRGSYISGVTVIAVPFTDSTGRMKYSGVFIDISERMESVGLDAIIRKMLDCAAEVQQLLITDAG